MPVIVAPVIFLELTIIFSFNIIENNKNPIETIAKRKLNEAKGDPWSTITFPVIKADDHNIIMIKFES